MAQKVRAKFKVSSIEQNEWDSIVKMEPVIGSEGENKDFNDATPAGDVRIHIHGDVPAANFFEVGKQYYADFSKAE